MMSVVCGLIRVRVDARACNQHNLHRTGHTGNDILHILGLRFGALSPLLFYLMADFVRCCGYFSREKTVLSRSHSSENFTQEEDNRCARSSIVVNKLRL